MKHSLDPACPCRDCSRDRDRFEAGATALIIFGCVAIGALIWIAVHT